MLFQGPGLILSYWQFEECELISNQISKMASRVNMVSWVTCMLLDKTIFPESTLFVEPKLVFIIFQT
jgi:hypothetical protein